jgi:hypothetical protein
MKSATTFWEMATSRTDTPVSCTHRLAAALTAHGLLRRDADGVLHLGQRFMTSSLVEVAKPVLEEITAETGESAQLWVRRGDVRVVVATVDSRQELRMALPTGTQLPLGAGGSAAAVLFGATDGSAGNGETPVWVESVSQRTPGIGSVSAPVRQHRDREATEIAAQSPRPAESSSATVRRARRTAGACTASHAAAAAFGSRGDSNGGAVATLVRTAVQTSRSTPHRSSRSAARPGLPTGRCGQESRPR